MQNLKIDKIKNALLQIRRHGLIEKEGYEETVTLLGNAINSIEELSIYLSQKIDICEPYAYVIEGVNGIPYTFKKQDWAEKAFKKPAE